MSNAEEIRSAQRKTWAGLSSSWEKWDSIILEQLNPVGDAMIESIHIKADLHHLDVASGTGEPGLKIAKLASKGRVVLTDLAPEMLEVAHRRALAQGALNVETVVCSADDLPFQNSTFDSVSVRFGYMFFPDLVNATEEFVRVLKPGGRLSSSVWIKPEENPWTSIVMKEIASEMELPRVDPDAPNMFRCAAPGYISALYNGAGLHDVVEWDVGVEVVTESPEQFWEMMSEHVSLAVAALKRVDETTRERIRQKVIAQAGEFREQGGIRVPGLARCIVGTK